MPGSSTDRSRNAAVLAAVLFLLAGLVAAYFLAYAAMLQDFQFAIDRRGLLIRPVYRWKHPIVEVAFTPANWCDRRLRPSRWRLPKPIPYPESASNTFILYERE